MKPCPVRDRLGLLLGAGLDADERSKLLAHVDDCPRCRETLRGLSGVAHGMRPETLVTGQEGATPVGTGSRRRPWSARPRGRSPAPSNRQSRPARTSPPGVRPSCRPRCGPT